MKRRIIEAALETLKREGFNGATARQIAGTGDFNTALIFYHFGTINDLLLAALDETSRTRLDRYRRALERAESLTEVIQIAEALYREDSESGHITVVAQMLAGASAFPELGPEVVKRMEPWIDVTADVVTRVASKSPLYELVPADKIAFGIVSLYLGMELLTHLQGDHLRAISMFQAAGDLAGLAEGLLGAPAGQG